MKERKKQLINNWYVLVLYGSVCGITGNIVRYLSCKVEHVLYLYDLFLIAHSALAAYQISPYRLRLK